MRRKLALPILILTSLALPLLTHAALININTANESTLETLPGIGTTKASAIIAYRNAHGPFTTTKDIENVSGIGDSTYANIAALITVGDTDTGSTGTTDTETQNTSASTTPAASVSATYTPPPSSLTISLSVPVAVFTHLPFQFRAIVENGDSVIDTHAHIVWSFGDGSSAEGTPVQKVFQYPGTYAVTVVATDGNAQAQSETTITVQNPQLVLSLKSGSGITITNQSSENIDLSHTRLSSGVGSFQMPVGMTILASSSVMVPSSVTGLPWSTDATLTSTDGTLLARYMPPVASVTVPIAVAATPKPLAKVVAAPIRSTQNVASQNITIDPSHVAIATATPLSTVPTTSSATDTETQSQTSNVIHSPWALGVLGVIVLAGGALMVL